jgi:hypothetical protein
MDSSVVESVDVVECCPLDMFDIVYKRGILGNPDGHGVIISDLVRNYY